MTNRDYSVIHSLRGSVPDSAIQALSLILTHVYDLNDRVTAVSKKPPKTLSLDEITRGIQQTKKLNVSQFLGVLAQPQNAAIPEVTVLPDVNDTLSQDSGVVRLNGVLYVFDGDPEPGSWAAMTAAAAIRDTHANRSTYTAASYPRIFYFETDRNVFYLSDGTNWIYATGIIRDTQANIAGIQAAAPALGVNDANLLLEVTDYDHVIQWTGAAWTWGPGEIGSGYYQLYEDAPNSIGANAWALCNGAVVARLNADGTTTNVTLDDVTTARYLKGGLTSAGIAAASGLTTLQAATNQAALTGITIADHPSHTHDEASTLDTPDLFVEDLTATGKAGRTGGPSATLTHPVTDPQHNHIQNAHDHGPNTLELANLRKRLYFRR